jgi:hypothetical protein
MGHTMRMSGAGSCQTSSRTTRHFALDSQLPDDLGMLLPTRPQTPLYKSTPVPTAIVVLVAYAECQIQIIRTGGPRPRTVRTIPSGGVVVAEVTAKRRVQVVGGRPAGTRVQWSWGKSPSGWTRTRRESATRLGHYFAGISSAGGSKAGWEALVRQRFGDRDRCAPDRVQGRTRALQPRYLQFKVAQISLDDDLHRSLLIFKDIVTDYKPRKFVE